MKESPYEISTLKNFTESTELYGLRAMYPKRTLYERVSAFEQLARIALKLEDPHVARDTAGEVSVFHGKEKRAVGEATELWWCNIRTKRLNLAAVGNRAGLGP